MHKLTKSHVNYRVMPNGWHCKGFQIQVCKKKRFSFGDESFFFTRQQFPLFLAALAFSSSVESKFNIFLQTEVVQKVTPSTGKIVLVHNILHTVQQDFNLCVSSFRQKTNKQTKSYFLHFYNLPWVFMHKGAHAQKRDVRPFSSKTSDVLKMK